MKDAIVLKDLEQIKAISQQYRLDIIDAFDNEPKTAKQIAEVLDEPHGRVNYHIKMLEKVGILELVEEVSKLGVVEKYYCPVAYKILIDSSAVTIDDLMDDTISKVSIALFESVAKDFYESIELFTEGITRKISYSADYYLSDQEAKALNSEISAVVTEFLKDKTEPKEGAYRHTIANMVIPMPAKIIGEKS
jgi:DNA-binding transcriptional ArsR family regulator